MIKIILAHLNVNSLRNKFDLLREQIKGSIDTLMISDDLGWFPDGQLLIEGYHLPFKFDRSKYGGRIVLYVWEDIPARVPWHYFPFAESFFIKINFLKRKWPFHCLYNTHKNNIIKLFLGDFNVLLIMRRWRHSVTHIV